MSRWQQIVCVGAVLVGSLAGTGTAVAQPPLEELDTQVQFSWGMGASPLYEGWVRNPDGTVDMWFGYLNQNWEETLYVPVGPDNHIEPDGDDRGQPTVFVPRRREGRATERRESFTFYVRVPADWNPDDQVVWTVTANGRTDRAVGLFTPLYELRTLDGNVPPQVSVRAASNTIALPGSVALTATIKDDGDPEDRRGRATIKWVNYRGPGPVTFESNGSSLPEGSHTATGVETSTVAHFTEPGDPGEAGEGR
jgi:hypothetical protein